MATTCPYSRDAIVAHLGDGGYWRSTFGGRLRGADSTADVDCVSPPERTAEKMRLEGYCVWHDAVPAAAWRPVLDRMVQLESAGWPPPFVFLFDEAWELFRQPAVRRLLAELLGQDYLQIPYLFAWRIARGDDSSGYRPHREAGSRGFTDPDGRPRALTVWIPLTEATADNGCMHVLPRSLDLAGVSKERLVEVYGEGPTGQLALAALLHRVRALPMGPGSLGCWNHETLHWGGFSSRFATEDRMSLALEFQVRDRSFVHPHSQIGGGEDADGVWLLEPDLGPPPFAERALIVARSIEAFQTERAEHGDLIEAAKLFVEQQVSRRFETTEPYADKQGVHA